MTDSILTRADVLAHVLEAARADDCVVAEYAERLVDDVLEDHDPYHTDSVVGEVAAVDLLGRMLKWFVRDRRDLSALVECLAVDSGVRLPYVALEQRHPREAGMKRAHPDAWVVIADDVGGAKVRQRFYRSKTGKLDSRHRLPTARPTPTEVSDPDEYDEIEIK